MIKITIYREAEKMIISRTDQAFYNHDSSYICEIASKQSKHSSMRKVN